MRALIRNLSRRVRARLAELRGGRWLRILLQRTFPIWESLGVHVTPRHYAQPIPDCRRLGDRPWARSSEMVGIRIDLAAQLELLDLFQRRYGAEYALFPRRGRGRPDEYTLDSGMLIGVDAAVLHCMLRHRKPRRVVEVGSGHSTVVSAAALAANAREDGGAAAELIAIEPEPSPWLRGIAGLTRLIERPVQEVPLEVFTALQADDVLFLDSSHVLKIGSDVQFEYLEILPRLAPGVLVHVHDIFLPDEYPRSWVMRNRWFWTEQYLLQAFLCFNDAWEVLWSGAYLRREHEPRLRAAFPIAQIDGRCPGSFWIRRVR